MIQKDNICTEEKAALEDYRNIVETSDHHKWSSSQTSRKHLRTKVTPDFHLTYSKNGGNLGSESK